MCAANRRHTGYGLSKMVANVAPSFASGVVTLSETSLILAIDRQTKSLKSLASAFAVVGNFRSI
jgi:hypothetical protein